MVGARDVPDLRVVVDAGCGEGDGLPLLGSRALGLDYDSGCLARARGSGAVARCNLVALPLTDAHVDVVVSLQVVEHLWSLESFLRECVRVLRPGGSLVVTTPIRLTFSPGLDRGARPLNPFHVRELDAAEQAGEPVRPLVDEAFWVQRRLFDTLSAQRSAGRWHERRPDLDQLLRRALLVLSSDWAFMVTRDSAAAYARSREADHRTAFHRLAELVSTGRRDEALAEAAHQRITDGPFGWLAGPPCSRS